MNEHWTGIALTGGILLDTPVGSDTPRRKAENARRGSIRALSV